MKRTLVTLVLGISMSNAAMADSSNMYVALDAGQSKFSDACTGAPASVSCKDTDTALRIGGGYNFTPMWGVEVSYADLGKAAFSGTLSGIPFNGSAKGTALQISGTGTFAINDAFSILAKVGLVDSTLKLDVTVPGFGAAGTSATKANVGFGVGAQYNFNKNVGVRVQYEDLGTFGDSSTTGTSKVQLISAGVLYYF